MDGILKSEKHETRNGLRPIVQHILSHLSLKTDYCLTKILAFVITSTDLSKRMSIYFWTVNAYSFKTEPFRSVFDKYKLESYSITK